VKKERTLGGVKKANEFLKCPPGRHEDTQPYKVKIHSVDV
jgi:hypothetical protein